MATETLTETLIKKLSDCAVECNKCMAACLEEEDISIMARCIELDIDCAEVCTITAAFIARNSESTSTLLAICGEICMACGEECQKHDAQHCQRCAAICLECAEMCAQA